MRAPSLTGAGAGRTVRTTASRRPGTGSPLGPHAPRLPPPPGADRRWVVDFTRVPTRSGFCYTAFVTGPVRASRIVGRGHRQPHGAPTTRPAPPGRRSGRARTARAVTPGGPAPPRWPVPVHRLHRTTRQRGHRSHRPEPWDPPTQAPPPGRWASPCKRGARSGATTPGAATARWVNWYNRTRPHLSNDDDPSPAAEHRYHRIPHHRRRGTRHGITTPPKTQDDPPSHHLQQPKP